MDRHHHEPPKPKPMPPFPGGPMPPRDRGVPRADDQLPLYSRVGRGPKGDSYKVRIASDSESATYLEGLVRANGSSEWTRDWLSENINGGKLSYTIVTNGDETDPRFQITFTYTREGRTEWTLTTPPIPYDWDGTGEWPDVAALIADALDHVHTDMGFGDDLEGDDPNGYTIKEYIDNLGDTLLTHFHTDLGFPANVMVMEGDGGSVEPNTVYEYITKALGDLLTHLHADLGWDPSLFEGDGNDDDPNSVKDFLEEAILDHTHVINDVVDWPLPIEKGGTAVSTDTLPMTANKALDNLGLTFGATPWTKLWSGELHSDGNGTGGGTVEIPNLHKYRLFGIMCQLSEKPNESTWRTIGNSPIHPDQTIVRDTYDTDQIVLIGARTQLDKRTFDPAWPEMLNACAIYDRGNATFAYVATFQIWTDGTHMTLQKASQQYQATSGNVHNTLCVKEIWGLI